MLASVINYNNNTGEWRNTLRTQGSQISNQARTYSGMAGRPIASNIHPTSCLPLWPLEALPPSFNPAAHSYLYLSWPMDQRPSLQRLSCEFLRSLTLGCFQLTQMTNLNPESIQRSNIFAPRPLLNKILPHFLKSLYGLFLNSFSISHKRYFQIPPFSSSSQPFEYNCVCLCPPSKSNSLSLLSPALRLPFLSRPSNCPLRSSSSRPRSSTTGLCILPLPRLPQQRLSMNSVVMDVFSVFNWPCLPLTFDRVGYCLRVFLSYLGFMTLLPCWTSSPTPRSQYLVAPLPLPSLKCWCSPCFPGTLFSFLAKALTTI